MFVCQLCKQLSGSGEAAHRVVIATRPVTYADNIGTVTRRGSEIALEVLAHERCAQARVDALPAYENRMMRRRKAGELAKMMPSRTMTPRRSVDMRRDTDD